MSDVSRRDALRRIGLALMAAGTIDRLSAEAVHRLAGAPTQAGAAFAPKTFREHEYRTLERLTDVIIPVEDGRPGALAAGAAAWIDTISSENEALQKIYRDGLSWIDAAARKGGAPDFVSAAPAQQTAILDAIAYRRNETPELAPGIAFFAWVRRMTVDAFYTSEIGIKDIGYRGNSALGTFVVPVESIRYALGRSGL